MCVHVRVCVHGCACMHVQGVWMCVCMRVCAWCVCVCVHACVCVCGCSFFRPLSGNCSVGIWAWTRFQAPVTPGVCTVFLFPAAARWSHVCPSGPDGARHDGKAGGSDVHAAATATSCAAAGQPHAAANAVSAGKWVKLWATCFCLELFGQRIPWLCDWMLNLYEGINT